MRGLSLFFTVNVKVAMFVPVVIALATDVRPDDPARATKDRLCHCGEGQPDVGLGPDASQVGRGYADVPLSAARQIIVSEALARKLFPGGSAVGRRVRPMCAIVSASP